MRNPSLLSQPRTARALASAAALTMAIGSLLGCSPASPAARAAASPEAPQTEPGAELLEPTSEGADGSGGAKEEPTSALTGGDSGGDPFADPAPASASEPASGPGASSSPAGASSSSERGGEAQGMIGFFEIGRGDRVADIGGLFGYSLEPILDAVGGAGVVYARLRPGLKPDAIPYAEPDRARQGELIWMKTPMATPLTPEATRLNAVTLLFAYHSVIAAGHDRKTFNDSIYRALVPGGKYIIVDHAAPPGSGLAAAKSLNRIEDHIVRSEVEAAGFRFVEAADFLINAARAPGQPPPSQYVLKFERPR